MQDLLAGNQPKIEGSTMNNETTANQPKSIGDDTQFLQLLTAVETAPRYSKELSEASAALIIAIDSKLRAPAAHASATIQAAPEELFAAHYYDPLHLVKHLHANIGWSGSVGNFVPVDDYLRQRFIACIKRADAATIQEPVMVAEPVTHELMQHLGTMRAVFHTNMLRAYPEKSHAEIAAEIDRALGAAPMVADPAGVAEGWQLVPKIPTQEMIYNTAAFDLEGEDDQNNACDIIYRAMLAAAPEPEAATVKAVPSEELARKLPSMKPDPLACIALAVSGALPDAQVGEIISAAFAAPLADKTGASGEKA